MSVKIYDIYIMDAIVTTGRTLSEHEERINALAEMTMKHQQDIEQLKNVVHEQNKRIEWNIGPRGYACILLCQVGVVLTPLVVTGLMRRYKK
jgi:hypothetical protein